MSTMPARPFWHDMEALTELAGRQLEINDLRAFEEPAKSPATPVAHVHDAMVFQPEGHPKQALIDGEVWPPIFKAENVRSAKTIQPRDSDVFVCTYPKCGTTWVQHICSQLLASNYDPEEGKVPELSMTSPMIEKVGAEYCDQLNYPRLLKTHFTHNNCPNGANAKYIFVARNPKDCLTSYYFHNRNFKIYDWASGDFDVFFELFASGQLAFGDYYDHLLSWLPHADEKNVLFLRYEDMYDDLDDAVYKIGRFLGGRAAELVENADAREEIVDNSRIDSMKKNQNRWFPAGHLRNDFVRKGGSRDWKNYMTKEQSDRIDAITRTRLAGTEAVNWWKAEMAWENVNGPPEIVVTSDDEDNEDEEELSSDAEEFTSVSRRCSCLLSPGHVPFLPERRNSMESIASSGYGSVWSVRV